MILKQKRSLAKEEEKTIWLFCIINILGDVCAPFNTKFRLQLFIVWDIILDHSPYRFGLAVC